MNLISISFYSISTIFIIMFIVGRCFIFKLDKKPNLKAKYSLFLVFVFLFYFLSIIVFVGSSLVQQQYFSLCLLVFIIIPFVIGKKATYEKLRFYSNLQIAVVFASIVSCVLIKP